MSLACNLFSMVSLHTLLKLTQRTMLCAILKAVTAVVLYNCVLSMTMAISCSSYVHLYYGVGVLCHSIPHFVSTPNTNSFIEFCFIPVLSIFIFIFNNSAWDDGDEITVKVKTRHFDSTFQYSIDPLESQFRHRCWMSL